MTEITPTLGELTEIEAQVRKEYPYVNSEFAKAEAKNRSRAAFYNRLRDRLIELTEGRTIQRGRHQLTARDLWLEYYDRFESDEQAIRIFRQLLLANGMLTGQARDQAKKLDISYVNPARRLGSKGE